jgi:hypothetical protein
VSPIQDARQRPEAKEMSSSAAPKAFPDALPAEVLPPHSAGKGRAILLLAAVALVGGGLTTWQLLGSRLGSSTPQKAAAGTAVPAAAKPASPQAIAAPAGTTTQPAGEPASLEDWDTADAAPQAVARGQLSAAGAPAALKGPDASAGKDESLKLDEEEADAFAASPAPKASEATPARQGKPASEAAPSAKPAAQAAKTAVPPFDFTKFKVNGVAADEDGGTAIINGRLLRLGDTIDSAKVVKITPQGVHLEYGGQVFVLGS